MHRLSIVAAAVCLAGLFAGTAAAALLMTRASHHRSVIPQPAVFVSSTGADSSSCRQAAPCLTLNRAYHVAKPGDLVQVAAGSYGAQRITLDSTKLSAVSDVVFAPPAGARASVASLTLQGSHITIRGIDVAAGGTIALGANDDRVIEANQAHNLTLDHVSAPVLYGNSASNVTIQHSSLGPQVDKASSIRACYQCSYMPQNWTFDDVTFHDYTRSKVAQHDECLQTYPVVGLTIRNSRFYNCSIMDLFLADGSGYCTTNVVIENTWFDFPGSHGGSLNRGYYPLLLRCRAANVGAPMNIRLAYNSFLGPFNADTPGSYAGVAVGNAATGGVCIAGVSYSRNVMSRACGASDVRANPGFVDAANFDLHLLRGAKAIGRGDASSHPAGDIDRELRPISWPSDAGADQWETALMVLGRSIGAARIGESEEDILAFYGPPRRRTNIVIGKRPLQRLTYRVHGGDLSVTLDQGAVVGISTGTRYYTTARSIGVGTDIAPVRSWPRVNWLDCRHAYRRTFGPVAVYIAPVGGKKGARIDSISMLRAAYGNCSSKTQN